MEEICAVLQDLDWSPLYISLKTGAVATVISFFLGLFAARKVIKAGPKIKAVADGLLTLPMVLPPTVAGFFCSAEEGRLACSCMINSISKWYKAGLDALLRRR